MFASERATRFASRKVPKIASKYAGCCLGVVSKPEIAAKSAADPCGTGLLAASIISSLARLERHFAGKYCPKYRSPFPKRSIAGGDMLAVEVEALVLARGARSPRSATMRKWFGSPRANVEPPEAVRCCARCGTDAYARGATVRWPVKLPRAPLLR